MAPTKRYYVYTLAHPNGMIFYVGKGTKSRAVSHLSEARKRMCSCQKCKIILGIWKAGLEVTVSYVFETDDEATALAREAELIHDLQHDYPLCNWEARGRRNAPRPPERAQHMTLTEYKEHLSYYSLSRKEIDQRIRAWGHTRSMELELRVDRALRKKRFEEARRLIDEIESINMATGLTRQRMLPLDFGK